MKSSANNISFFLFLLILQKLEEGKIQEVNVKFCLKQKGVIRVNIGIAVTVLR